MPITEFPMSLYAKATERAHTTSCAIRNVLYSGEKRLYVVESRREGIVGPDIENVELSLYRGIYAYSI